MRQSLSEESIEALQEIFDDDEGLARQVLVKYFMAHRLLYHSTPGLIVTTKKKKLYLVGMHDI